jgi:hypothetical protein
MTLSDFDGPERTFRPTGDRTVCGPLVRLAARVVVVLTAGVPVLEVPGRDVLALKALIGRRLADAMASWPLEAKGLASSTTRLANTGATDHARLCVLPAGLSVRTSIPRGLARSYFGMNGDFRCSGGEAGDVR